MDSDVQAHSTAVQVRDGRSSLARARLLPSALALVLLACGGWESHSTAHGDTDAGGEGGMGADVGPLTVRIVEPIDEEVVRGGVPIQVSVEGAAEGVEAIHVLIDERISVPLVGTASSWGITWDSCVAGDGDHSLVARVTDGSGRSAEDEVVFTLGNAAVGPVLRGSGSREANRLDWEDCGEFERYRIFWDTEPGIDADSRPLEPELPFSFLHRPNRTADRYYYRVAAVSGEVLGSLSNEVEITPEDFGPSVCSGDGWCWEAGPPQGHDLSWVWSFSNHDTLASGWNTAVAWNGLGWTQVGLSGEPSYGPIWGANPSDVWVGGSWLRHWNGNVLEVIRNGPESIDSIWGTAADRVWALAWDGAWLFDGSGWTRLEAETLESYHRTDVWATALNDVWVAGYGMSGEDGTMLHFDGASWTVARTGDPGRLAVWGSGSEDVWSVGRYGSILHFDGTRWSNVPSGTIETLNDVHGCAGDDVWAVGTHGTVLHYDGAAWSDRSPPTDMDLASVWCNREGTTWVVGERGETLRWDGAWSDATAERRGPLRSVAETAAGVTVTGEYETVLRRDEDRWTRLQGTLARQYPNVGIHSLHGASPDDVWAVGDSGVMLHFDGESWTPFPSVTSYSLLAVWASAPDDVWAAGLDGALLHYDGEKWTGHSAGHAPHLNGMWGTSANDIWAVGWETILHYDGVDWSRIPSTALQGETVQGIWGFASNDVYAVGTHESIIHWDGDAWSPYMPGAAVAPFLHGVHGSSADDLWIVGTDYYLHRQGDSWTRTDRELSWAPIGVWSRSPSDVFVATELEMRHFDGEVWTETALPSFRLLNGVKGVGSDAYAVGDVGTIFKHEGDAWIRQMPASYEPQHLGATWIESPTSLWVVGDYGEIRHYDGTAWQTHSSGILTPLYAIAGHRATTFGLPELRAPCFTTMGIAGRPCRAGPISTSTGYGRSQVERSWPLPERSTRDTW
jgi:hypothetical protein